MSGKNILLAVVGMSPAVITETLYALHKQERRVDEIHFITTGKGERELETTIYASNSTKNKIQQFCKEYGIDINTISYTSDTNMHVLSDQHGNQLDDILTADHNEILLSKCLELAWRFTQNPDDSVFFLVAGGRNSMTSCLTLAAQFYGRPQDRIYQVLVAPDWVEECEFWFPRTTAEAIKDRSGKIRGETGDISINLINIPFPKVRLYLPAASLHGPATPGDLMANLIKDDQPELIIDLNNRKIRFGDFEELDFVSSSYKLSPVAFAIYAYIGILKSKCNPNLSCSACNDCYIPGNSFVANSGLQHLYRIIKKRESDSTLAANIDPINILSYFSKIKHAVAMTYGRLSNGIMIDTIGENPVRYGLAIDHSRIHIIPSCPEL